MKVCQKCGGRFDDAVGFCPNDGEVLQKDYAAMVGQTLDGQYKIEAFIAAGGMGAVYRAQHILLGDRVAIKLLAPEMRGNAEWLKRFQREGQVARRFRHPNAVTVHDLRMSSDGFIYMVMEYVEGRTLDAELKTRGRFQPAECFSVLDPVASVLDAAHAMGIVHRDLKPENIMLGRSPSGQMTVKLLDLGIAKMRESADPHAGAATALTVAGQVLGTPYYMSPEQWGEIPKDGNTEIDGRADIYSLGLIIYEMVTGRRPFSAQTLHQMRRDHISTVPRPVHELVPGVPEAFGRAVARAMAKDRADRQPTAGALINELRAALNLAPMKAIAPGLDPYKTSVGIGETAVGSAPETDSLRAQGRPETKTAGVDTVAPTAVGGASRPQTPPGASTHPQAKATADAGAPLPTIAASVQPGPTFPDQISAPPVETKGDGAGVINQRRRAPLLLLASVPLVLLVLVSVAVAALWFYPEVRRRLSGSIEPGSNVNANANVGIAASSPSPTKPASVEVVRHWVDFAAGVRGSPVQRLADERISARSGQYFRFNFVPTESGYLYIVGPGERDVPTAFLTAKPHPASGVKTNEVKGGVTYTFPTGKEANGDEHWLGLEKRPGTDKFTVIFSSQPITSLAFLNAAAGQPLSPADQRELDNFINENRAKAPVTIVKESDGGGPTVKITRSAAQAADLPVIFNISIEHN